MNLIFLHYGLSNVNSSSKIKLNSSKHDGSNESDAFGKVSETKNQISQEIP